MKLLVVLLSLMFAVSCRPAKNPAAPEGQNGSLSDALQVAQSLGRIESAVAQIKSSKVGVSDPLTEQIRQALINAKCTINYVRLGQPPVREVHLEISGKDCPITAKYDLYSATPTASSGQININAQFKIHDPTLCLNNDICDMTVAGLGEFERIGATYDIQMNVRGNAISNRLGPVGFTAAHDFKMTFSSPQSYSVYGTQTVRFSQPTAILAMNALLRKTVSTDSSTYFIDGTPVGRDVYVETLVALGALIGL